MQGDVSFDNIGKALLQVLQVVSLESWSSQMYYLLDGIGSAVVVYYFCLIIIGTYFALNLLVAVISAKFAQLHVRPNWGHASCTDPPPLPPPRLQRTAQKICQIFLHGTVPAGSRLWRHICQTACMH